MATATKAAATATKTAPRPAPKPAAPKPGPKVAPKPPAPAPAPKATATVPAPREKTVNPDVAAKLAVPVKGYRSGPNGNGKTAMRRVGSLRAKGHAWRADGRTDAGLRKFACECGFDEGTAKTEYEGRDHHQKHLAELRKTGAAEVTEKS